MQSPINADDHRKKRSWILHKFESDPGYCIIHVQSGKVLNYDNGQTTMQDARWSNDLNNDASDKKLRNNTHKRTRTWFIHPLTNGLIPYEALPFKANYERGDIANISYEHLVHSGNNQLLISPSFQLGDLENVNRLYLKRNVNRSYLCTQTQDLTIAPDGVNTFSNFAVLNEGECKDLSTFKGTVTNMYTSEDNFFPYGCIRDHSGAAYFQTTRTQTSCDNFQSNGFYCHGHTRAPDNNPPVDDIPFDDTIVNPTPAGNSGYYKVTDVQHV